MKEKLYISKEIQAIDLSKKEIQAIEFPHPT